MFADRDCGTGATAVANSIKSNIAITTVERGVNDEFRVPRAWTQAATHHRHTTASALPVSLKKVRKGEKRERVCWDVKWMELADEV